jgi:hypothetical protein|tara:strand:- start:580 stop:822 length:243 start_codon:yes stop_codon:yes gene_type:complete
MTNVIAVWIKWKGDYVGSIKNVLLHCQEHMKDYDEHGIWEDKGRYINQGWIEALMYVERNFDVTEKTINEQQKGKNNEDS